MERVSKRGRPGHSREHVIEVAVTEFNNRGYEATSMSSLASLLRVSKSALYHHVSSKEEILEEAVRSALLKLEAAVAAAFTQTLDGGDRLKLLIRGLVDAVCDSPDNARLAFDMRGNTEMERDLILRRAGIEEALQIAVEEAVEAKALRSCAEPRVVTSLVWGMIASASELPRKNGEVSPARLADVITELLLKNMGE